MERIRIVRRDFAMWRILFTLKGRDSVVLNFDVVIEDVWFWFGLD
jgi:hypothetical protein